MHQASILMNALVLIMGGAWFALHEMQASKAEIEAGQPAMVASVHTGILAE